MYQIKINDTNSLIEEEKYSRMIHLKESSSFNEINNESTSLLHQEQNDKWMALVNKLPEQSHVLLSSSSSSSVSSSSSSLQENDSFQEMNISPILSNDSFDLEKQQNEQYQKSYNNIITKMKYNSNTSKYNSASTKYNSNNSKSTKCNSNTSKSKYNSNTTPKSSSSKKSEGESKTVVEIASILSTSFAYGFIMTTLVLVILPLECIRMDKDSTIVSINKNDNVSIVLGMLVFSAGFTQLICPIIGILSDNSIPYHPWGKRRPFLSCGGIICLFSLLSLLQSSIHKHWIMYFTSYLSFMIGINIIYSCMIAFIPDLIPNAQLGQANGILAFEIVSGSLIGFICFHLLNENIFGMYVLYILILVCSVVITCCMAREYTIVDQLRYFDYDDDRDYSSVVFMYIMSFWDVLCSSFQKKDTTVLGLLCSAYDMSSITNAMDFFYCTISRTFYYMGISVQTFLLYFIHDYRLYKSDPQSMVSNIALITQLSGLVICYPIGIISDYFQIRRVFIYTACVILSIGCMLFITYVNTVWQLYFVAMMLGCGNGVYLTMETSLAVDSLPKEDEETIEKVSYNKENTLLLPDKEEETHGQSAHLLGIWGVAGFIGSALGPFIGGPLLYIFGQWDYSNIFSISHTASIYHPHEVDDPYYKNMGYIILFTLSSFYFICSAYVLRYVTSAK